MPPSTVHVNGSVNLPDTEAVLRALAEHVPELARLPDGETGERHLWIAFQEGKFGAAKGLGPVPDQEDRLAELGARLTRVEDNFDPSAIEFPDLGFADYYIDSYKTFRTLQDDGVIGADKRFQVQYPSALAPTSSYVDAPDVLRVLPAYEAALFADLDRVIAAVPAPSLAVQWDLPVEIGVLEMPEFFPISESCGIAELASFVARGIDRVPRDIPVGLHLCYGDFEHRHFVEPKSLATQVELLNAIEAAASRELSWSALTVPQYADAPEFFAPLANLGSGTSELVLGIVPYHPTDQQPGTTDTQVRLIDQYLDGRRWGIATECGLANVEPGEMGAMLDQHSELLSRFGG